MWSDDARDDNEHRAHLGRTGVSWRATSSLKTTDLCSHPRFLTSKLRATSKWSTRKFVTAGPLARELILRGNQKSALPGGRRREVVHDNERRDCPRRRAAERKG